MGIEVEIGFLIVAFWGLIGGMPLIIIITIIIIIIIIITIIKLSKPGFFYLIWKKSNALSAWDGLWVGHRVED